eukprot:Rmarinus@m.18434
MAAITRKWSVFVFAICIVVDVFAACFFLRPYYSISGPMRVYSGPVEMTLPPGRYLMSTYVASSEIYEKARRHVVLQAGFADQRHPFFSTNNSLGLECVYDHTLGEHPCAQYTHKRINFVSFHSNTAEDEDSDVTRGFHSDSFKFEVVGDEPVEIEIQLDLLLYDSKADGEYVDPRYPHSHSTCHDMGDCEAFRSETMADDRTKVAEDSLRCYPPKDISVGTMNDYHTYVEGCAMRIHLGDAAGCNVKKMFSFWDAELHRYHTHGDCDFIVEWAMYERPPPILVTAWQWGALAFASVYVLWLYMSMMLARELHLNYLSHYYYRDMTRVPLKEGERYHFKLIVTGEQFSKCHGVVTLQSESSLPMLEFPIHAEFSEADVAGCNVESRLFRYSFISPRTVAAATLRVAWAEDFLVANFREPEVFAEFRRSFPQRIKTRLNILLMPVFFFWHTLTGHPPRNRFVRYENYVFLSLYLSLIYLTVAEVMFYTIAVFAQRFVAAGEHWNSICWGDVDQRPPLPLAAYAVFLMIGVAPAVCCLPLRWCQPAPLPLNRRWNRPTDAILLSGASFSYSDNVVRLSRVSYGGFRDPSRRTESDLNLSSDFLPLIPASPGSARSVGVGATLPPHSGYYYNEDTSNEVPVAEADHSFFSSSSLPKCSVDADCASSVSGGLGSLLNSPLTPGTPWDSLAIRDPLPPRYPKSTSPYRKQPSTRPSPRHRSQDVLPVIPNPLLFDSQDLNFTGSAVDKSVRDTLVSSAPGRASSSAFSRNGARGAAAAGPSTKHSFGPIVVTTPPQGSQSPRKLPQPGSSTRRRQQQQGDGGTGTTHGGGKSNGGGKNVGASYSDLFAEADRAADPTSCNPIGRKPLHAPVAADAAARRRNGGPATLVVPALPPPPPALTSPTKPELQTHPAELSPPHPQSDPSHDPRATLIAHEVDAQAAPSSPLARQSRCALPPVRPLQTNAPKSPDSHRGPSPEAPVTSAVHSTAESPLPANRTHTTTDSN